MGYKYVLNAEPFNIDVIHKNKGKGKFVSYLKLCAISIILQGIVKIEKSEITLQLRW